MKSSKSTLWILIITIIIIDLCQVNQAIKPGLKDNSTLSKKIIKRRLSQDQLFEDLNDDSGSDGTSFYFLPAKTIRGNTRYGYMQDSVDSNGGDISYLESDEEIKSSSARSGSILPNGRPGRMRVRRVEQSPSLLPSADHLIESNSEYKFDDFIVPNSSSSAKRNYNSSSASLLASPSSSSSASSASPYEANHGSRSTSFGSRRRIKIKEIQSDPNMEPRSDPISHFMEVDMKENEEGKELLDPGSSEIRDTIEPRSPHFKQNFRNSDSLDSVNSFSRFKSNSEDFEGTLPRPQSSLLSDSDSNANNGQSNPQYRPNYEHYESRGGSPSRNRETLGLESGFTGIVPGSSSGLSSSSSSSSRQLHPSLIRSTENSDSVRGNRARYFRPQTVGDYRQSNHAYINAARPPTILIPNQDIRQQLPRPYFVTTLPPTLTSSLPYTTYSDLSMVGLSHYQSGNSEFDSRPQSHRNSQTGRRPSSHYRTMIADHLVDEDEPVGYNGRGLTTVSPLPSQPTSRPTRGTTSTTSTTRASTELTRTRPISRDYHYNYDGDRQRQPNYDYPDQPTTRLNNPNPRLNNRHSNDRSHRNQFYSQATATTTSTTTTTTTPRPNHRYQHNNNDDNNFDRTNDRGQPQNYRNDYDSPGQTGTVAPTSESDQPNQSDPGPRPFRIRPAGRPGGGRRRRKRPRNPLGSNQAAGPANKPSTTTTTTTTTTTAPPPAPYYYDDYEDNDDYEYDYQPTTTTTTHRPRRKGRRGQGGRRQRTSTTPSTTTTTTPAPTTKTLSPGYKPRPDNRIIDYMVDPNFPHELKGADLTDYPFYISLPTEIHFNCEGRHDGYYASIEHKCQVYHHCALGHRYDFLCPNYTLFDQTTFTCRFVNTVDCLKSENHFNRNDDLYAVTTDKPEDGGKSSKNEKERSKRDDKEAIKTEASSINKQTSSDLNNNFNNSSNSDSFKKEIIAKLELNGEKSNNSDNLNNKTKVRNKETKKDESYKT